jgi:hypothetical protein
MLPFKNTGFASLHSALSRMLFASCAMQVLGDNGKMKVLITLLGRSVWGLVNSSWASMRTYGFIPDRVHIIDAGTDGGDAEEASRRLRILLHGFNADADISFEKVEAGNISSVSSTIKRLIDEHRAEGNHIAIDVTSGTKDLVLGSLMNDLTGVDHIFYLRIDSLRNADRPYILIPVEGQQIIDVLAEVQP